MRKTKSGLALIMVIAVLVILLITAVSISISMRVEKRMSGGILRKARARMAAEGAVNYAAARLSLGCEEEEILQTDPQFSTPDYDSAQEWEIDLAAKLKKMIKLDDSRGAIWSARVEDEQGKINVNSASPWLLGNLIGSAIVTRSVRATDDTIMVDSTRGFAESGYLWVYGELIQYRKISENSFRGCQRGLYAEQSPRFHAAKDLSPGTMLIDARAYRLCQYRVRSHPGNFTIFRTIEEIRRIADKGAYIIEPELFERLAPLITAHSGRNSNWIHRQKIGNDLPGDDKTKPDWIYLANTNYYRPGMTIRISQGNKSEYALILHVSYNKISLDSKMTMRFNAGEASVEVLEPHPVNINSAQPAVLYSLFKGLKTPRGWINSRQASALTGAIMEWREKKGAIKSLDDLHLIMKKLKARRGSKGITLSELRAILSSAHTISNARSRFGGINTIPYYDSYRSPNPPLASIIYKSYDTYTIEGNAVLNDGSGAPIAEYTMRRLMTVAPDSPAIWSINSQHQFESFMAHLPSWRVISKPKFVHYFDTLPEMRRGAPGTALIPDTISILSPNPEGGKINTFQAWNNTFEGMTFAGKKEPALKLQMSGPEIAPFCISFWLSSSGKNSNMFIFDFGERPWSNRARLYYQGNKLVFEITDATLEQSVAQISANISLGKEWHHIMATAYSTNPGGLALWVDGQPRGKSSYRGRTEYRAILKRELKLDDTFVYLDNAGGFPREGVVRIGDEAIEYSDILGNALVVRTEYRGFEKESLGRGARKTVAQEHPAGVQVDPFGYSEKIADEITPGTRLTMAMPEENVYAILRKPLSKDSQTIIVHDDKKFKKFPPSGFLLIADLFSSRIEKIRYFRKGSGELQQCKRGQFDTSALDFEGAYLFPISMAVENNGHFFEPGIVQVDNEWIAYNRILDNNYFIFSIGNREIDNFKRTQEWHPEYRSKYGTMGTNHESGALALPVFRAGYGKAGRGDLVTLVDGKEPERKEELTVNWVSQGYISFAEDVSRNYYAGSNTRLLKFPSGELPGASKNHKWGAPLFAKGITPVTIDELKVIQMSQRGRFFLASPAGTGENQLRINSPVGLPQDGALMKIGDEYISYWFAQEEQQGQFGVPINTQRSFAESKSSIYSAGTAFYPVFFIATSTLNANLEENDAAVLLVDGRDFANEGYIKCGPEIIGYSRKSKDQLFMPGDHLNRGIFRGAFGSNKQSHTSGKLVYAFAARYWDRYAVGYDGTELAYFEAAKNAPGAYWQSIQWREQNNNEHFGVEVRIRINGKPDWSQPATNRSGGIYSFRDGRARNPIGLYGDTLQIRVYFYYNRGAYPGTAWKDKPGLKSIQVKYRRPLKIWQNEE